MSLAGSRVINRDRLLAATRLTGTSSPADDLSREEIHHNGQVQPTLRRELWRMVQRKLKVLDGAARVDKLAIPAGNRLERLKGQRAERHSIRVNDHYRVTFRWESGHAYEVCVEDYH